MDGVQSPGPWRPPAKPGGSNARSHEHGNRCPTDVGHDTVPVPQQYAAALAGASTISRRDEATRTGSEPVQLGRRQRHAPDTVTEVDVDRGLAVARGDATEPVPVVGDPFTDLETLHRPERCLPGDVERALERLTRRGGRHGLQHPPPCEPAHTWVTPKTRDGRSAVLGAGCWRPHEGPGSRVCGGVDLEPDRLAHLDGQGLGAPRGGQAVQELKPPAVAEVVRRA